MIKFKKPFCLGLILIVGVLITFPALAEAGDRKMAIDITPIVQAVISLLAMIITAKVIPWIKAKTSAEQQAALMSAARIAVYAAEQVYGAGHGEEKLALAQRYLMSHGYVLDIQAIEAAVREMNMESMLIPENTTTFDETE